MAVVLVGALLLAVMAASGASVALMLILLGVMVVLAVGWGV